MSGYWLNWWYWSAYHSGEDHVDIDLRSAIPDLQNITNIFQIGLTEQENDAEDGSYYGNVCPDKKSPTLIVTAWLKILSKPRNVQATKGTYCNKVVITWEKVFGATYYNIYRNNKKIKSNISGTSYTDSEASATGQTYTVVACNPVANSHPSDGVTGYTKKKITTPTGVSATKGEYCDKVKITWNSVSGARYYTVYKGSSVLKSNITSQSYDDYSATTSPQTYYVTATGECNESPKSQGVQGYKRSPLPAPRNFQASKTNCQDVYLTWDKVANATSYNVYKEGYSVPYGTNIQRNYYIDKHASFESKVYYVTAVGTCGESSKSNTDKGYRKRVTLESPWNVTASQGTYCDKVHITWDKVDNAVSYTVYRGSSKLKSGITGTSYNDNTASTSPQTYQVTAISECNTESAKSNGATGYKKKTTIQSPGNVTASQGTYCDKVHITWDKVDGAVSYTVYRNSSKLKSGITGTSYNDNTASTSPQTYQVTAISECNTESAKSKEVSGYLCQTSTPTAAFTANTTIGTTPLTVSFTDNSTGSPTSWSWDFGDGSTSTKQNPTHTYQKAGKYTVKLTVTNDQGSDTKTKTDYITVNGNLPVADFSASPTSGKVPLTVAFTDNSTGNPTSWSWDFGDGSSSTEQNPSHTYSKAGSYTVKLTATNDQGSDTKTKTDYITVNGNLPVADFTANTTTGTAPLTISFTDNSTGNPSSWSWDFGDGGTSTVQNPSHTYQKAGKYTVKLTVTNDQGSNTETKTDYITVYEVTTGTFTDPRDGKTYKTVKIGTQTWMAENLAYLPSVSPGSIGSETEPYYPYYYVYGYFGTSVSEAKATDNYTTYGVLYNWPAAKAACPSGWHLPTDEEWKTLEMYLGMSQSQADAGGWRGTDEGKKMKSTSGWYNGGNGTDEVGFSALPGGDREIDGDFWDLGYFGYWWSATAGGDSTFARFRILSYGSMGLAYDGDGVGSYSIAKDHGFSIRCVRDNTTSAPVAAFSANTTTGTAPLTVSFTDNSTGNPTSWSWDFGDGTKDTVQNPVHIYQKAGSYTVSLIVGNQNGRDTLTRPNYIQVQEGIQMHFTPAWSGNPYQPMTIIVKSAGIYGVSLKENDEIGVFAKIQNKEVCVGSTRVKTPITNNNPLSITVSADDPTTSAIDGYNNGGKIYFKLWDETNQTLLQNVSVVYSTSFDKVFTTLGTAIVNLSGYAHFQTVWTGNPYQPMNILVDTVEMNNDTLKQGDEVGVFDVNSSGSKICVGAAIVSSPISRKKPLSVIVSNDDPGTTPTDGFIKDHKIIYKIWKAKKQKEVSNFSAKYSPAFDAVFNPLGTAIASLTQIITDDLTQKIGLITGWNMISLYVTPDSLGMLKVLNPLVSSGSLIKAIDEKGGFVQNIPGVGWMNTIGDMANTEGYYIKVSKNDTLQATGLPVNLPFTIPLQTGWNMMGYPVQSGQDAMAALKKLTDSSQLVKVINEAGGFIQNIPGVGWMNTIGNFEPGEGYYVKVNHNTQITFNKPAKEAFVPAPGNAAYAMPVPRYFNKVFKGNPYYPMNIVVTGIDLKGLPIHAGDEVAAFDKDICVGVGVVPKDTYLPVNIVASLDDPSTEQTDGYVPGDEITLRYMSPELGSPVTVTSTTLSGVSVFTPLETRVCGIAASAKSVESHLKNTQNAFRVYPNPAKTRITVTGVDKAQVQVFDIYGKCIYTATPDTYKLIIDLQAYPPGTYTLRIIKEDKLTYKKFVVLNH